MFFISSAWNMLLFFSLFMASCFSSGAKSKFFAFCSLLIDCPFCCPWSGVDAVPQRKLLSKIPYGWSRNLPLNISMRVWCGTYLVKKCVLLDIILFQAEMYRFLICRNSSKFSTILNLSTHKTQCCHSEDVNQFQKRIIFQMNFAADGSEICYRGNLALFQCRKSLVSCGAFIFVRWKYLFNQ